MIILLGDICNDYVLASILTIIRRTLNLIQILVPVILIIASSIQLAKLVLNPDNDKKEMKKIYNSFLSAVIVFFIPMVINLSINVIYQYGDVGLVEGSSVSPFNLSSCWVEVEQSQNAMDSVRENGGSRKSTISKEKAKNKTTLGSSGYVEGSVGESSNNSSYSSSNKNSKGEAVISYAKQFVGNPYVWGGTDLRRGADCSGFIQSVYKNFNVNLPRTSYDQGKVGEEVGGIEKARAGDIIYYGNHVALFLGDGKKIVHASNPSSGIKISPDASYRKIISIRRIFTD